MNKQDVTKFFKSAKIAVSKHSPEILTGIGIAGMITTTVLAVKATPKALQKIEEKKEDLEVDELTPVETVKAAWKPYIPAAVLCVTSTACLIGASRVSLKRNAALATAYQLSTTALNEYKDKVVETFGEKKEKTVREKIAQDKIDKHPISKSEVIVAGTGDVMFMEPVTMRPFKSDIETVRKVVNDINYRLTSGYEEYITLSEFFDEIGLPRTGISDELGWNIGRDGQLEIDMIAAKDDNGRPCLMLEYTVFPRRDYKGYM